MPVFLALNDTNIFDPVFWAAQNITPDSTINASAVSDTTQITLTGTSITVTDTTTGTVASFGATDIAGGSFANIVAFTGNDADNIVGGSVGLDAQGYVGGSGDDLFTDDGATGGQMNGGAGNDTIIGGTGDNQIQGGNGDDLLIGGSGNNNLQGGTGADTLVAGDGSGNLLGGNGSDVIIAGLNTTFVDGGNGNNSMQIPVGATFAPFSPGGSNGTVTVTLPDGSTRSYTYLNIAESNITVVCFAGGTRIKTPDGDVAVENLSVGDLVLTQSDGAQPLRWVGKRRVTAQGRFAPIRFSPGSVGNDRALLVSPQHRMLISGWRCEMLFGEAEVLCAAKHLVDGDRITRAPQPWIDYHHIMFDRHQVVFAEGAPAESLFVGDHQMRADPQLFDELLTLFPELADQDHPARALTHRALRAHEALALRTLISDA